jgi:CheY-like chemotaxis protein
VDVDVRRLDVEGHPNWPDVPSGTYVRISVSDTGTGMDEATRIRVFDPFFTTKELGHGTGLGLSTVHGIVKQAGGHIRVTSQPGQGSCFEILLPHYADTSVEPPREANVAKSSAGSETVLVVEDQPQVQRAARRILVAAGYRVLAAANGEQALRLAGEHAGRIDLLVTDVIMPGLSGIELSRHMLRVDPEIAVLLVSGYAGNEITALDELGSSDEFLQKPFDATSLTASARNALDKRAPRRTPEAASRAPDPDESAIGK